MAKSSRTPRRTRLATLTAVFFTVYTLSLSACIAQTPNSTPPTGPLTNSATARTRAIQLVTGTATALGLPQSKLDSLGNSSCGGDGFAHGPDIQIQESTTFSMPASASITSYFDTAMAYWRQQGFTQIGPQDSSDASLPPAQWSTTIAKASEPDGSFNVRIEKYYGPLSLIIIAQSACVYPIGTDNPSYAELQDSSP